VISSGNEQTVLLVEDDPDTAEAMEMAISMEGYPIRVASDQADALDMLPLTKPSVILLDYYGVASDIKKFVARIRAIHPKVPIVLMTGARDADSKAKELGLKDCLPKPFGADALRNILKKHCPAARSKVKLNERIQIDIF
jgi:DNA-binding response OmpR family regulator